MITVTDRILRAAPNRTPIHNERLAEIVVVAMLFCSSCGNSSSAHTSGSNETCGVVVSDSSARSCDLAVETTTTEVTTFDKSVRGSSQQMGTRLAVAFTAREDKPLTGPLVHFSVADGGTCSPKLTSSTCYDRTGKALDGVTVNLHSGG